MTRRYDPSRKNTPRYRPELAEAVYWLMMLATAVRAVAEVLASFSASPALPITIALAGLGQLAGTLLFVVSMWTRIRMPGVASVRSAREDP